MSNKTFIFLPETGIYPYFRTLLTTAECIGKNSDIICLKCSGQLEICTSLASCGKHNCMEQEKKELCKNCHKLLIKAQKEYNFSYIDLNEIITLEKRSELNSLIPHKIDDCYNFKYKDFEVGQIAIYDLVLATKILDTNNLSIEHQKLYRRYIINTLIALEICDYVVNKCQPDIILAFNPYSECQAAKFIAHKNNVKFEFLTNVAHMGADYSKFYFSNDFMVTDWFKICQSWQKYSDIPLTPNQVYLSWEDSIYRSFGSGSHIFSSSKNMEPDEILKKLKLQKNKKTIVAFTSSNDEFIGINIFLKVWKIKDTGSDIFPNTLEWLRFLYIFSQKNKDLQIIVRIHPREGNRQLGKPSEHYLLLKKEFTKQTDNFVIIWPNEKISSYDLFELADLALVTLSTMGQEAARVGIPFISTASGKYYSNASFMKTPKTLEDYEKSLLKLVNSNSTYGMLRDAIRYNYWRNFIASLDFSDTIPSDFSDSTIWPHINSQKEGIVKKVCLNETDLYEYNITQWKNNLSEKSEIDEKIAILKGIQKYINRIMLSQESPNNFYLLFIKLLFKFLRGISLKRFKLNAQEYLFSKIRNQNPEIVSQENNSYFKAKLSIVENNVISYTYKRKHYIRYSPLLYRLTKTYFQLINEVK